MPVPFRIHADPLGGTVEVDGRDITPDIEAIDLRIGRTEPSVLSVHLIPGHGLIEGSGIVQLIEPCATDPAEIIRLFLGSVDALDLEKRALENTDWGSSTAEAFLAALRSLL